MLSQGGLNALCAALWHPTGDCYRRFDVAREADIMSTVEQVSIAESSTNHATEIKHIIASSVIGTAVEWYDFLIYGTATALVFNKLFFPLSDPALGTIAARAKDATVTN
jgi:hypothetical protein